MILMENQKKMQESSSSSHETRYMEALLREQEKLENDLKKFGTLKSTISRELLHLSSFINRTNGSSSSSVSGPNEELQRQVKRVDEELGAFSKILRSSSSMLSNYRRESERLFGEIGKLPMPKEQQRLIQALSNSVLLGNPFT